MLLTKWVRRLWLNCLCLNDYLADFLVWMAIRISPDVKHELWRADYTYSTCVKIARGECKTLQDAKNAAYGAVY